MKEGKQATHWSSPSSIVSASTKCGRKSSVLAYNLVFRANSATLLENGHCAAAKGNTLLNYVGVRDDVVPFVCDAAPSKQDKYLPGSHIPILAPAAMKERKPDIVLILPWNLADEVVRQHGYIREMGGRFAVAVPEINLLS